MIKISHPGVSLTVALAILSTNAHAQERAFSVYIAAQPAAQALQELAAKTGANILFDPAVVDGVRATQLRATVTAEQGARQLLAGTGLEIVRDDTGGLIVKRRPARSLKVALYPASDRRISAAPVQYVAAQAAPAEGAALEEVVVTARKVTEKLQDTPIAVGAFSGDTIQKQATRTLADLSASTPSLSIERATSVDPIASYIRIRGLGQTDNIVGQDQPVATYIDNVYVSGSNGQGVLNLFDVNRVEVLKGPQGTLFGRNTTGGAFTIYTNEPSDHFEAQVLGGVGNEGQRRFAAMLNAPVAENAALRVVGELNRETGWMRSQLGSRYGDSNIKSVRAAFKFQPTSRLTALLRADYQLAKAGGTPQRQSFIGLGPYSGVTGAATPPGTITSVERAAALDLCGASCLDATASPATLNARLNAFIPAAQAALANYVNSPHDIRGANFPSWQRFEAWSASATLSYDVGAGATLKSITAVRRSHSSRVGDLDGTIFNILHSLADITAVKQITEELQLTGTTFDNRLKYAAGFYYYDYRGHGLQGSATLPGLAAFGNLVDTNPATTVGTANAYTTVDGLIRKRSPAVYAQGTFAVTDTINVTAGLRQTWEKYRIESRGLQVRNDGSLRCNVPGSNVLPPCLATGRTSFKGLSYTAGVDWHPVKDVMLYAKTSRGYKSGGIPFRTTVSAATLLPYAPEKVQDVEVGVKSEFLDRRLRVNVDAYRMKYTNAQKANTLRDPITGSIGSSLANVASALIRGVEGEVTALPVQNLRVDASVGYTDARYNSFLLSRFDASGTLIPASARTADQLRADDLSGDHFENTPRWTYTLGGTYTWPTEFGQIQGNLLWRWQSSAYPTSTGGPPTPDFAIRQKAYGLLSGSLRTTFDKQNLTVSLWGRNLLNKDYCAYFLDLVRSGLGSVSCIVGQPRTYGVEASVKF